MINIENTGMIAEARAAALPLENASDLDPLIDYIGDARIIAIGEASHGNHEYAALRTEITRRLITACGDFSFIAIEADQSDCKEIDQSIRQTDGTVTDPGEVLYEQQHWPSWMWANQETLDFCRWLRDHNHGLPAEQRVSWQGLDVYPLWGAIRGTLDYMSDRTSDEINEVLDAPLRGEPMVPESEIHVVVEQLAAAYNDVPEIDAKTYYRALLRGGVEGMNIRSTHWLHALDQQLSKHGPNARGIVWAHDTHVGDTRGTGMDFVSIGQLIRERYGSHNVVLIGSSGGDGTVMAAHQRGDLMDAIPIPKPRHNSVEALLSEATRGEQALFIFPEQRSGWLAAELGHRAIGAVYNPNSEPYPSTRLGARYDALAWYPRVSPIQALHLEAARQGEFEVLRSRGSNNPENEP